VTYWEKRGCGRLAERKKLRKKRRSRLFREKTAVPTKQETRE